MRRPQKGEYGDFYQHYIDHTRGADHLLNLEDSSDMLLEILEELPPEKYDVAYAPGKWTIRQLLQHLVDTDQVFSYRALWLVRSGGGSLPGYDHNIWADQSLQNLPPFGELLTQFRNFRQFSLSFFHSLHKEQLEIKGEMNAYPIVVRSIPFIMAGHCFHHLKVIEQRYLNPDSAGAA